jgi:hypothetical protein
LQSQEALAAEPGDYAADVRQKLVAMARGAGEWCGIPMPLKDQRLIVESKHPLHEFLKTAGPEEKPWDGKLINVFWSSRLRSEIAIWLDPDGSRHWGVIPGANHIKYDLATMACAPAWSVQAESKALSKLETLIPEHAFKKYLLAGMFIETSTRSKVSYIFRKLKPTIALRPDPTTDEMRVLATLCLHPIGYYEGTWAGSMVPADDTIAHLLMMRADEHLYWKRANQISAVRPEAGL